MSVEARHFIGVDRLEIVIVDRHPQFLLDLGRLAGDEPVDIDVAIDDLDGFAGQSDETLDVVLRGIGGVLEHHNIPASGLLELVDAFEHEDSVAVGHRDLFAPRVVPAAGASRLLADRYRPGGNRVLRHAVAVRHESVIVPVSALRAAEAEVGPFERIGHAARGNPEGLHHERAEYERQNEGGDQPFEGVCDLRGAILLLGGDRSFFLGLVDSVVSHSLLSCPQMTAYRFLGGDGRTQILACGRTSRPAHNRRPIMPPRAVTVNRGNFLAEST